MIKRFLLFAAFACIVQNFYCQETDTIPKSTGGFIISVGPSFPMSDFGADSVDYDYNYPLDNKALAAGTGIALNFDYILPLWKNGIGVFLGAGINYNGTKADYKENFEKDHLAKYEIEKEYISYQKYFSIPLSTGLNYTHNFNKKIGLFGNFGIVANILKITDQEVTFKVGEQTKTYDARTTLGLRFGGGILLNNRFILSLNYTDTGNVKIKYERDFVSDNPIYETHSKYSIKSKISYLNLTVGIKL